MSYFYCGECTYLGKSSIITSMEKAVWDLKSHFETHEDTPVFDCMVAEFLLSEGRFVPKQEVVLAQYHVNTLEELAVKQKERFAAVPKLYTLFSTIEMPLVEVLWRMEQTGITLDTKRLEAVGVDIAKAILVAEEKIKKEVGFDINLNSSVQIGNFLAEKLYVPLKKTKTGRYATNENEIAQYAEQYPIIQDLLTYRELSKLRSTYVDSLIDKVDKGGRVHTTYNQVAVSTGRLSSSNPNLQNIPVTSAIGQQIKSCFTASPGKTLISFDYSQQELRILAHLTGEETLIEAFQKGKDVHKTTASQLFGTSYDTVTKEQRMIAKTINFGIIYGMSSYGMSMTLHIPVEDAQRFIDTFYLTYPKIQHYYDAYLRQGKIDGYVETILGRRRYVFEDPKRKFIDNNMRRVLINYPIQGSAADLMKKAMVAVYNVVKRSDTNKLLLQIHDDLVFEIPDDEQKIREFAATIRTIMCTIYPLIVPMEVDVKVGKQWGDMENFNAEK